MIASHRRCLERDELQLVLAGRLPASEFDSAISHLDDCDLCRSAAEALDTDGRWLLDSLAEENADPLQAETACQVALWRMLQSPSNSDAIPVHRGHHGPEHLGPYKLLETLGTGGMGTVYLAQHERLKRKCAIKLLPRERVNQAGWLGRFEREMTTVASLEHPNIVRATDAGHQDGWHYLVMEYLDGLDVGRVARRIQSMGVADACEIVRQSSLGLAHIHEAGLVHRDIKPSNLMLTQRGEVKLLDLGLVLDGDDPLGVNDQLTTVGHLMGTMSYMAPEQLADSHGVDTRADVYSLGATLFRLIAGRPPHERTGTLASHILSITNDDSPPLNKFCPQVDQNVAQLVGEMLSRQPSQRPASADEVAERLAPHTQDSRLKGLMRESLRRSEPTAAGAAAVATMPSVSGDREPPRKTWNRWLAGGLFAAILFGAFLLKIQTDKGELVVHSEQNDLTVVVIQDAKIVEHLKIEKGSDNRVELRKGTYRVAIEGGGEALRLSDEVVTIGRKTETPIKVIQNLSNAESLTSEDRLFQGKPFEHWMSVLQREQDSVALGEAMNAVEVLSRDTPQRAEAAKCTLHLARELGGMTVDETGEPSQAFMSRFLRIFPRYLPETGLPLLNEELLQGTNQSKLASAWAIHHYLGGIRDIGVGSFGEFPGEKKAAQNWCANKINDENRNQLLDSLIRNLGSVSADGYKRGTREGLFTAEIATNCEMSLAIKRGIPIVINEQIERKVRETIAKDKAALETSDAYYPLMSVDLLAAAVQIAKTKSDYAEWRHLADSLFRGSIGRSEIFFHPGEGVLRSTSGRLRDERVFDAIAEKASAELLEAISGRLNECVPSEADETISQPQRRAAIAFDLYHPKGKPFRFFGRNARPTSSSISLLTNALEQVNNGTLHNANGEEVKKEPTTSAIEDAIKTLKTRGGDALKLSDEVSTERKTETPTRETPIVPPVRSATTADRSYQGEPFIHWWNLLRREQDPATLGEAMRALEVLTRNTPERAEAAASTLHVARELGGWLEHKSDPSAEFMSQFLEIFVDYLPQPGMQLLNEELTHGTAKSKIASVYAFEEFLARGRRNSRRFDSAADWCSNKNNDKERQQLLGSLNAVISEGESQDTKRGRLLADAAARSHIYLSLYSGRKVTIGHSVERFVREAIEENKAELVRREKMGQSILDNSTQLSAVELAAAVSMAEKSETADWEYLAHALLAGKRRWTIGLEYSFDVIAKNAPAVLLDAMSEKIKPIKPPIKDETTKQSIFQRWHVSSIDGWNGKSFVFYGENAIPSDDTIVPLSNALARVIDMAPYGKDGTTKVRSTTQTSIEQALKTLKERRTAKE